MNPHLENAAMKAVETLIQYRVNPAHADPLMILKKLSNVLLLPYDSDYVDMPGDNQDAFTLVNKKNGKLQFIVLYRQDISKYQLRIALARELAHVILEHDGNSPEYIWSEEASCFAHHFLCPLVLTHSEAFAKIIKRSKPINYKPKRSSEHWEMKCIQVFDSIDDMKAHIAQERNLFYRYIGKTGIHYEPVNVELTSHCDHDVLTGWKNCYDVVIDGEKVGFCGE